MNQPTPRRMNLADCKWLRFFTLCVLYFAQGVPWGFVSIALVAVLSEQGATVAQTGGLVALSALPWTFKLIWGPLIDSFGLPSFGRRRPWIVLAQACMAATLLIGVSTSEITSEASLATLGTIVFLHNCFASLQDVATDALAIDVLAVRERGRANGMMWASKLVGASVGGVGMAFMMGSVGLPTAMQTMAELMLVIMVLPLLVLEREGDRRFPWSRKAAIVASTPNSSRAPAQQTGPLVVVRSLLRSLGTQATFVGLFVSLGAGMCCAMVVPINAEVFTQVLGWSAESYSATHATFGTAGKLIGAVGGGLLCSRIGARGLFTTGALVASGTLALHAATSSLWLHASYPLQTYVLLLEAGLAMSGVGFLTLGMNLSWTTAAATQFTLYMTMSNVGRAIAPMLAGLGLTHVKLYSLAALLGLLPVTLLPFVDVRTIERRRRSEEAEDSQLEEATGPLLA